MVWRWDYTKIEFGIRNGNATIFEHRLLLLEIKWCNLTRSSIAFALFRMINHSTKIRSICFIFLLCSISVIYGLYFLHWPYYCGWNDDDFHEIEWANYNSSQKGNHCLVKKMHYKTMLSARLSGVTKICYGKTDGLDIVILSIIELLYLMLYCDTE